MSLDFNSLGLNPSLINALKGLNFEKMTPIQDLAIPEALGGKDIIACAQTGSGKTAAFAVPVLEALHKNPQQSALILAPTRELAQQISSVFRDLTKFSPELQVCLLVGGANMFRQINFLKRRPRIIVATPGRLNDHLRRYNALLRNTKFLVLDEGDRMLDMGFAPQLDELLKYLPSERQNFLFTATLPEKVKKLAQKYLKNPKQISAGSHSQPVALIQQTAVSVEPRDKNLKIVDELNKREGSIIIFTKTKRRTDVLARHLDDMGFSVGLIHGGCSQGQRNRALKTFREGGCRILCATDVAARGIDIPQVQHVINFDLPMQDEDYVHRIGRTGRNGAKGEALTFVTPEEHRSWNILTRKYKIQGANLEDTWFQKKQNNAQRKKKPSRFSKTKKFRDSKPFSKDSSKHGSEKRSFNKGKKFSKGSFQPPARQQ